MAFTYKRSS